jgi:hypothetical protein
LTKSITGSENLSTYAPSLSVDCALLVLRDMVHDAGDRLGAQLAVDPLGWWLCALRERGRLVSFFERMAKHVISR